MMVNTFSDLHVTGKLSNPLDVISFLSENKVELMITDLSMPELNGLELGRMVKARFPDIKVLVLTVSDSAELLQQAKDLGLDGYILKKTSKEVLNRAIRQILSGDTYFIPG
jgi:DNA-binding NarL/FixJ family response regulator